MELETKQSSRKSSDGLPPRKKPLPKKPAKKKSRKLQWTKEEEEARQKRQQAIKELEEIRKTQGKLRPLPSKKGVPNTKANAQLADRFLWSLGSKED